MPLPNSYPGFRWGSVGAPVMIEGFLDLLCPDCSGAWPTVLSVLNHYGPSKVSFTFHVFPLPYHTFAFLAAQGAQVIKSVNGSDAAVFDYISLIFANQDSFYSTTQSISQITDAYATLVAANLPYTKAAFLAGVRQGATPFPPARRPPARAPVPHRSLCPHCARWPTTTSTSSRASTGSMPLRVTPPVLLTFSSTAFPSTIKSLTEPRRSGTQCSTR